MTTVNDVYRKIKEMSAEQWKPRPVLAISSISERLLSDKDYLMPLLTSLSDMKLIRFDMAKHSIQLTLLGNVVTRERR